MAVTSWMRPRSTLPLAKCLEPAASTEDTRETPLVQVTIEGELRKAKLIEGVLPKYPEEALKSRITGTVELHVVFEKGGTVRLVEVVSGHPLFAQAAVDGMRDWKYPPTMLNGKPVEVDTLAFVTFALGGALTTNPSARTFDRARFR